MTITGGEPNWLKAGRTDLAVFALGGFGVKLHEAQIAAGQAILDNVAQFYELHWANRSGKTTLVQMLHAHALWYKRGVPVATTTTDRDGRWFQTDYATLHLAPLNELAGRMHEAFVSILSGTSLAQLDTDTGEYRVAALAQLFAATRERSETGADHLFLRCLLSGARTDIRSTEGKARRLESGAWRFIVWDEWTQTENPDDIRGILFNRLTARAADFDAPILLTGTSNEDVEHIAKEFTERAEDPADRDWWGISAARSLNPSATQRSLDVALRNLDPEDYARTVLGQYGGVKGRIFPSVMVDPIFRNDLPALTPPQAGDGFRATGASEWFYYHVWDLAIAEADNVGIVARLPADFSFGWHERDGMRALRPIEGVRLRIVPGSRTLTDDEIRSSIEETFLLYGGQIVLDTTDAHGKGISRALRAAGYPVDEFTFNERDGRKVIRKDAAIEHTRTLLTEGATLVRDAAGEPEHDDDGVPRFDWFSQPYGVLRLPGTWTKPKDQLSVLKVDDRRQQKDAAMVVLMLCDVAYRARRSKQRRDVPQRLAVFGTPRRQFVGAR